MLWLGYVGLTALVLCWIPQTIDTVKKGKCSVSLGFLLLSALGSLCLAIYAFNLGNFVFTILNFLTTLGTLVNTYYKLSPRSDQEGKA